MPDRRVTLGLCFALAIAFSITSFAVSEESSDVEVAPASTTYAFVNVSVITMDPEQSRQVLKRQTVIVRDGKIIKMERNRKRKPVRIPKNAIVIDAKGKYLMPGLADMHGHMQWVRFPQFGVDRFDIYDIYIGYGVTTVYNMIGFDTRANQTTPMMSVLEMKRRMNDGEEFGPRLYSTGLLIFDSFTANADIAENQVRRDAQNGWDGIKVINPLARDKYVRAVETAQQMGIRILGHYPRGGVTPTEMIENGHDQISHVMELTVSSYPSYTNTSIPVGSDAEIIALAQKLIAHDIWLAPTTALSEATYKRSVPELMEDLKGAPWMKYVPPAVRQSWAQSSRFTETNWWGRLFPFQYKQTGIFFNEGVKLLIGGDPELPFKLHGESLLEEIEGFAKSAGVPNYDTLRIATYNAAEFIGNLDEQGLIRVDMSPDFILLGGNPISDLAKLRDLQGVMLRGQWLDRADLDARLQRVADKFGAASVPAANSAEVQQLREFQWCSCESGHVPHK